MTLAQLRSLFVPGSAFLALSITSFLSLSVPPGILFAKRPSLEETMDFIVLNTPNQEGKDTFELH